MLWQLLHLIPSHKVLHELSYKHLIFYQTTNSSTDLETTRFDTHHWAHWSTSKTLIIAHSSNNFAHNEKQLLNISARPSRTKQQGAISLITTLILMLHTWKTCFKSLENATELQHHYHRLQSELTALCLPTWLSYWSEDLEKSTGNCGLVNIFADKVYIHPWIWN